LYCIEDKFSYGHWLRQTHLVWWCNRCWVCRQQLHSSFLAGIVNHMYTAV